MNPSPQPTQGSPRPSHSVLRWIRSLGLRSLVTLPFALLTAAPITPLSPGVDEGELLLTELNCVACHVPSAAAARRLPARQAPRLGAQGLRLEPAWIKDWLLNPAQLHPGTPMPHLLAGLDDATRTQAADALTQYLVSSQAAGSPSYLGADKARLAVGQERFHTLGCVACHVPQVRPPDMPEDVWNQARTHAAPFGPLARKYPGGELVRFLQNPVAHRPGGRMPSLNLTDSDALAISTYLLADQAPGMTDTNRPLRTMPGLKWEYYEGRVGSTADLDRMQPVTSGETTELVTSMAKRGEGYALRFTGVLRAPKDGEYTFWINSDDGSTLDVDGKRVVNNDGEHPPREVDGKVKLTAGVHTFELRFYQGGGGSEFQVRWAGPEFTRQAIPATALEHYGQPMLPVGHVELVIDSGQVSKGREWFTQLKCAACHSMEGGLTPVPTQTAAITGIPALAALKGREAQGCLADTVKPGLPRYTLTGQQRMALRRTLASADRLAGDRPPEQEVAATLARFNCLACHERGGVGGPAAIAKDGWFTLVGEADLGEEGKLPPHLNGVGAKLRPTWMQKLLAEGTKVRPYMATRMPLFGTDNVGHLPALLAAVDRRPAALAEPAVSERDAKYGRKLVGRDGLSCVACHTFSTYGSMGIPALALDRMHERLEWDWFRRYLPDPAALRPGTRMPSFWPENRAVNTEILNGQTDAQIQAIWSWLAGGAKADVPAGLIRAKQELMVGREAVIYRHFIEGAGSRAIGVGYPEKANLAFDANQLRLALIWQGSFIDLARHSTDRGTGYEPPLGDHVVRLPEGAPFALLPSAEAPWPAAANRSPGYRFLGYTLDDVRRPTFRYEFAGVRVEDAILPKTADVDVTLVRTLKFGSGQPTGPVWFRAATGDLQAQADGSFLLDGKVRFRFRGGQAIIVGKELRVPVTVPGELVEEITW
jgi:mono/diheme cytochrome c family protein